MGKFNPAQNRAIKKVSGTGGQTWAKGRKLKAESRFHSMKGDGRKF
jgi:hypothetical protein